jgi:uncharacterized protein (TIGR03067 family)
MQQTSYLLGVAILLFAVPAEMERLQGTWTAESADFQFTVKGDEFTLMPLASKGPEHFPFGHFKIDSSAKPKKIEFIVEPYFHGMKTSTVLGTYELDGDNLKLQYGRSESVVFKRVK